MDTQEEKKLNSFFSQYKPAKAKKGEILIRPGDTGSQMIFLKTGKIRQYVISKLGQELNINIINPGFPFAFIDFLTETKNRYYFEAFSAIEYWRIPKKEFKDYMDQNPDVFWYLTKQSFCRLEELFINLEYFITGDAYMKVASTFYLVAKRDGKESANNQYEIESMPTHRDISETLGLTRETVSLQILKLEKDGVIKRKGRRLTIPDMKKLEDASAYVSE